MVAPKRMLTRVSTRLDMQHQNQTAYFQHQCQTCTVICLRKLDNIRSKKQVFVKKSLRIINRIFWPKTITNEELLNICSCQPITTEIKKRKWRWIGHTLCKEDTDIAKMSLEWNPQGARRRERPRMTWMRSTHTEYQDRYSWQIV